MLEIDVYQHPNCSGMGANTSRDENGVIFKPFSISVTSYDGWLARRTARFLKDEWKHVS